MKYKASEVMQFVAENDVKFIRLAFCDIFGTQKNISIMPAKLEEAFESGIAIEENAVSVLGGADGGKLVLRPDPSTLSVLPWRPSHGRVVRLYCTAERSEDACECDCRSILIKVGKRAADMGYTVQIGTECEFYLFKQDEDGKITQIPHDTGTYMDVAPADKGENIRREICLTMEQMGINPEMSHHGPGPGQNKIDLKRGGVLEAADNFITFKNVVKTAAASAGLYASFMPHPLEHDAKSRLYINFSVCKDGVNILDKTDNNIKTAQNFKAGILAHTNEIAAFLKPLTNSYHSADEDKTTNTSQIIQISDAHERQKEFRFFAADPSCNPYLAFALLLHAGLDGIEKGMLTDDESFSAFSVPKDLSQALLSAQDSKFVTDIIPGKLLDIYVSSKQKDILRLNNNSSEHDIYFNRI